MATNDTLTPKEASYIAHNSYFTLKDWITGQPHIGMESTSNVRKMVTGDGLGKSSLGGGANTSLGSTDLKGAKLQRVFAGSTAGTSTGFGYVLGFRRGGSKHVVVATRGTRFEHSKADIYTDMHGSLSSFAGFGQVHCGFKNTFDSVKAGLKGEERRVMDADVVHCVGHSLGGAVATLVASHFAAQGKSVRLYTFGCPRVGAYGAANAMERAIGKENVFRVSHDLDPVTMVGPFPFSHLNGAQTDANNMTLRSPTGLLLSFANHDMEKYVYSVSGGQEMDWDAVRALGALVDHDNAALARWLLRSSDNPSWMTQKAARGLSHLLKVFSYVLKAAGVAAISAMTAIDLFSAILAGNLSKVVERDAEMGEAIRQAAGWAGVVMTSAAQFTASVIRAILSAMMSVLKPIALQALQRATATGIPLPLIIDGAAALTGALIS